MGFVVNGILKNDIEMKITLKIEESKIELFMRLIKGLEFVELVKDESDIPLWQQEEIDKRLKDLEQNPESAIDFNQMVKDIEEKYGL